MSAESQMQREPLIQLTREIKSRTFVLHAEQWLPCPRERLFAFFSDAFQLETLTPALLRFEVVTPPPIVIRQGTLIDYKLRLHGIPVRWQSEISEWEPPSRFVDRQTRGPYRLWRHEHRFVEQDGGTLVIDHVDYRVTGGRLVNRLFVAPDLRRIFGFRMQKLQELFGQPMQAH
jgi:ligand-binding SRPBCC domain-containing protein